MFEPATWQDDPICGHQVAQLFQTHYCTYIRAPRLLTLQSPYTSCRSEMLFQAAHQTFELWFKVLLIDLHTAMALTAAETQEAAKLLQRDVRLLRLLRAQAHLLETVLLTDPDRQLILQPLDDIRSDQFDELQVAVQELSAGERDQLPADALQALTMVEMELRYLGERFQKLLQFAPASGAFDRQAYLELDALLTLQDGPKGAWAREGETPSALASSEPIYPDQMLFIVVHQAFEIWFKVLLEHIDEARLALLAEPPNVARATQMVRRIVALQRFMREQIIIPTTMLPLDFLQFRDEVKIENGITYKRGLAPSSGTESYQFREIEIASGLRHDPGLLQFLAGSDKMKFNPLTQRQEQRLQEPTLAEAFEAALRQRGVGQVDDIFTPADMPNLHADLAQLVELLLEYDEYFRFWRQAHVSMVERMIGGRSGTGDFGPEYLKETVGFKAAWQNRLLEPSQTRPRFFESLWEARTRMKLDLVSPE